MNIHPFPSQIKTSKRQSRATKQRTKKFLIHSPSSGSAGLWIDKLGWLPLFSERDRINSELVYAVPKIKLIQKGRSRTKPSFIVPPQADNCKDTEHPMHTGTKAGDADNSI